jgi:hypothetical protein
MLNSAKEELRTVPERETLLKRADDQWEAAKENCNLAMRLACKTLPILPWISSFADLQL